MEATIRTSRWRLVRGSRFEAAKDFPYTAEWNGVIYATKRVPPIFVKESEEPIVITAYTYFF